MALKHVGRFKNGRGKVAVAYRTLPNDPHHALVVKTESLDAAQHDDLMRLIESNAGQNAGELAEAMNRTTLSDGRNMLVGFHTYGKLEKVPTDQIEMVPDSRSSVLLSELNLQIAAQKGVALEDLAISSGSDAKQQKTTEVSNAPAQDSGVLDDEALAASFRSQADALFKEAKRLREQAEELSPTKRKSKASAEEV